MILHRLVDSQCKLRSTFVSSLYIYGFMVIYHMAVEETRKRDALCAPCMHIAPSWRLLLQPRQQQQSKTKKKSPLHRGKTNPFTFTSTSTAQVASPITACTHSSALRTLHNPLPSPPSTSSTTNLIPPLGTISCFNSHPALLANSQTTASQSPINCTSNSICLQGSRQI